MTSTPHDAMFKAAFSKLRHARGLLRTLVPAALARRLDWSSLRIESGIAVDDEELDEQRMDLVFSVKAGRRRLLLYVLAEHQSRVDRWMVLRLLSYLVALWKGYRAQHPRAKRLPAIVPLVVHHGRHRWTAPVAFEEALDVDAELLEALGPYVPRFRFLLDDLPEQSDAELRGRRGMSAGGKVVMVALKHGRDTLTARLRLLYKDRRTPGVGDVFVTVLRYILETSRTDPVDMRGLLARQMGPEAAEEIMTTAEMLRREGRAEGRREVLLRQLRRRFGELPAAAAARIQKASGAELNTWTDRVLTAASLAEVLGTKAQRKG